MLGLTDKNILNSLRECSQKSNYSVGIIPASDHSRNHAIDVIKSATASMRNCAVHKTENFICVKFDNGSSVRLINPITGMRKSNAVNLILFDNELSSVMKRYAQKHLVKI